MVPVSTVLDPIADNFFKHKTSNLCRLSVPHDNTYGKVEKFATAPFWYSWYLLSNNSMKFGTFSLQRILKKNFKIQTLPQSTVFVGVKFNNPEL